MEGKRTGRWRTGDSLTLGWVLLCTAAPLGAEVRISEFLALNTQTLADQDGDFSDWVELENTGLASEPLTGWTLSDDPSDLTRWEFPAVELPPGAFLVVFASGKARAAADAELHTDFRLSSDGEFLALVRPDGTVADAYTEPPEQHADISYGRANDGTSGAFFATPTPGAANSDSSIGVLPAPVVDRPRGFYNERFELIFSSADPDAEIRYTTDGNTPSLENSTSFDSPVRIATTTVLRGRSFRAGYIPSRTTTHSYVFVEDVHTQDNAPPGYPSTWKSDSGGTLPADYEMDPEITENPRYTDVLEDALLAVPTISLVTDVEHLFSETKGIYQNPQSQGALWERPVSVEWLYADGREGTQIDAGIRVQGGASRLPTKSPKHSFRLAFRRKYGAATLRFPVFERGGSVEEFNTIILRAGFNQSWIHHNTSLGDQRGRGQCIRDQWMKDTQRAMGQISPHNGYAHVYLNGLYWGLYNPTERPESWFAAAYLGGEPEDYDATNSGVPIDGSIAGYNDVLALARKDLSDPVALAAVTRRVDFDSLADYMIVNQYAGNMDWDGHNWYAVLGRNGGPLHYLSWDAESIFLNETDNRLSLNNSQGPSGVFRRLMTTPEFSRLFANRIQRHFFGDGALTLAAILERWERRSQHVVEAIVAESARWGDYRRDVHRSGSPSVLLERDVHWQRERTRLIEQYFPAREARVITQYRGSRYYPSVDAPEIAPPDRVIGPQTTVWLSAPTGTVYYTTDGSDPRLADDGISPAAVEGWQGTEDVLLALGATSRYLVPESADVDDVWYRDGFDDSTWKSGATGIGFGSNEDLLALVATNVEAAMRGAYTSVYIRIPFNVTEVPDVDDLVLRVRYDDGFVAYLNGQEIARRGAPDEVSWDSRSTLSRANVQTIRPEDVILPIAPKALRRGENVVAFHVMNRSRSGPDLLMAPQLVARKRAGVRFELNETTLVRTRTLLNGEWSALAERLFSRSAGLRVSELHYHPKHNEPPASDGALEFIELTNAAPVTLDLTGVRFTAGIEYVFSDGTTLPSGGILVLAKSSEALTARYGELAALAGEFEGSLDNGGEAIRITGPLDEVILDFAYKDHWYPSTDGGGFSLVAVEPTASEDAFYLRESWAPSAAPDGSPGESTSPGVRTRGLQRPGDANQDARLDITDALRIVRLLIGDAAATAPCAGDATRGGNAALLDVNADDAFNLTDALHLLNHLFQRGPAPAGGAGCVRVAGCDDVCLR